MTKSNDEIQKEMKELRSNFCVYSFLIILTIAGFCLRHTIPWSWLKAIINFLFIGSVFELGRSIDKYLKLRKQLE
ncbi:patatin family protein [Limosilactobacillus balticus]|uniref:patatin family protein n=1 Tax=Limosilactobacillus balticus TaxID=2759747 RepID=UPI001E567E6E|nr:patatin family protein [Limosilactobacillus balticus]MCD7131916.1 patatin family protein [Limosilactobacillus balticus]